MKQYVLNRIEEQPDGCWHWTGARDTNGYGNAWHDGAYHKAHRLAYIALIGPIPDGLVLDHLCRNTQCVNPAHLEPVTVAENNLRGDHPNFKTARTGVCARGHDMAIHARVNRSDGRTRCAECAREAAARRRLAGS